MVFKKPYAFLIKNFKILHLVLAGLMLYLIVKINLLTNLFNKLADNISVSLDGIASEYVSVFMYFVLILILLLAFVIWFLMKNKKKPNKYYLFLMLYYLVIFVFLLVYASALSSLEEVSMTNNALRAYSDISFLLPLGQYYFLIIAIIRGIGFNIKQFNFSKDVKDLEISDEDSEEIEVNLSNNTYKYFRYGRKHLRELKYYFFENKYWILIIIGIVLIIGIVYFFVNYKFVNNNYSQRSSVNAGSYNVLVNNVYVTDKNLYGNIIKENKKYVIVGIKVRNIFYEAIELDLKKFILDIGGEYHYPITNKNSSFQDLGLPYEQKLLETNTEYNYILIYEVNKKVNTKKMSLKLYQSMDYEKNKANFANIKLNAINLNQKQIVKTVELGESYTLNKEKFKETSIDIQNYSLINNFEYNYELCVNDECSEKIGVITPNDVLNNKLLRIDYDLFIDEESLINNFIVDAKTFFNTFVTISYNYNGSVRNINFNAITNSNINNVIFMEVSKDIENSSSIELIINTRTNKYLYKLK